MIPAGKRFASAAVMLRLTAGFIIWGLHFLVIYAFAAVACARGFAGLSLMGVGIVPLVIVLATLAALALNAVLVAANLPRRGGTGDHVEDFIRWFTLAVAVTGSIAIVLDALPILFLRDCR